jgi:hypothetical protein
MTREARCALTVPVYCKAKGGLCWVGEAPAPMPVNIEWIGRFTGIDPDNVKRIERQPKRWLITLVHP